MKITHEFFSVKKSDLETPRDHREKLIELEKECDFPQFRTDLLKQKIITSITDKTLPDTLFKEKNLYVSKIVKQIRQNTYDRKSENYTKWEATISIRQKNLNRTHPQNDIYGKIWNRTERKTKRTKMQILQRTKLESQPQMSSPTCHNYEKKGHIAKASGFEHRKQQHFKEITQPEENDGSDINRSMNKLTEIKHEIDRRSHSNKTKKLKREKNFEDNGLSAISLPPEIKTKNTQKL